MPVLPTEFPAAALALIMTVCLAACGGSMPADAKVYRPGAAGVDEALADLDASEAEISSRFGGAVSSASPGGSYPQGPAQPGYQQPPAQPGRWAAPPAPPPPPPVGTISPVQEEPNQPAEAPAADAPGPVAPSSGLSDAEDAERDEKRRCEVACRALGSMKRAAEHVCRATGTSDARCGRARNRVTAASERVAASCEDCEG